MTSSNNSIVQMTNEEQEAIDRDWKNFCDTVNINAPAGQQFFMAKETEETLRRNNASNALINLAKSYLREANNESSVPDLIPDNIEKEMLIKKAAHSAITATIIEPTEPLNLYEAGKILEKTNEKQNAKICYLSFSKLAPDTLLNNAKTDYKHFIQVALNDIKERKILD